jgi:cell wall-associated NlpC family hydrolase
MIAEIALTWVGTPFKWQGRVKGVGCDCKGMVAGVAKEAGRPEADSVYALARDYRKIGGRLTQGLDSLFDRVTEAQPGDILLMLLGGKPEHLAIVTKSENGVPKRMVHCYHTGPSKVIDVPVGTITRSQIAAIYRWRDYAA